MISTPHVLLVEDEFLIRMNTTEFLQDAGFVVIEAWDGHEAIRLLETIDCLHLLFTDVRMPGTVDGVDLAHHVRQRYPTLPVLVVSGYAPDLPARLDALSPPLTFISKPYKHRDIVQTLKQFTADA